MSINSLTNLINQTVPYAWDNSLSMMEFLGKIVTSMNQVIALVNEKLPDDFETAFYLKFREYTREEMDRIVASGQFETILTSILSGVQDVLDRITPLENKVDNTNKNTFNVLSYGADITGTLDSTAAFNALTANAPAGSKIVFPLGTYKGNFISTKPFEIDFNGSTLIPVTNNDSVVEFKGSVVATKSVVGNPIYGQTAFTVTEAAGLGVGDVGYLVDDSARPSDGTININRELVKIKSINGTVITVVDMIRSNQNTGSVKFNKIATLKSPKVKNVKVVGTGTHVGSIIRFEGCENAADENVTAENFYGNGVAYINCYGFLSNNFKGIKPRSTTSGAGYGVACAGSRNGLVNNPYGNGTRHLVDMDSSFNVHAENVTEENGQDSAVSLSHNGYGGNNSINNLNAVTEGYAVSFSGAIANKDLQVARDLHITNINHVVPLSKPNSYGVSIYIELDYENVVIENVKKFYADITVLPNDSSYLIRIDGNQKGTLKINNIQANSCGSLVFLQRRSSAYFKNHVTDIKNISAVKSVVPVWIRGIVSVAIDGVSCESVSEALLRFDKITDVNIAEINLGENIGDLTNKLISPNSTFAPTGVTGKIPNFTALSTSSKTLTGSDAITQEETLKYSGYLKLMVPNGVDVTLGSIAKSLWLGQKLTLVINELGYVGTRGNVILPGTGNFADSVTLQKGKVYTLIGYGPNGLWKVIG